MSILHDPNILPPGLPVPQDDGAARHLEGLKLPSLTGREIIPVRAAVGQRCAMSNIRLCG